MTESLWERVRSCWIDGCCVLVIQIPAVQKGVAPIHAYPSIDMCWLQWALPAMQPKTNPPSCKWPPTVWDFPPASNLGLGGGAKMRTRASRPKLKAT